MRFECTILDEYIEVLCSIIERKMYKVCSILINREYINAYKSYLDGDYEIKFKVLMTQQEINNFCENFTFLGPCFEEYGIDYYDFDLEKLAKESNEKIDEYSNWELNQKIEIVKSNFALDSKPYLRDYIDKITSGQDYLRSFDEVVFTYTNQLKKELK